MTSVDSPRGYFHMQLGGKGNERTALTLTSEWYLCAGSVERCPATLLRLPNPILWTADVFPLKEEAAQTEQLVAAASRTPKGKGTEDRVTLINEGLACGANSQLSLHSLERVEGKGFLGDR